MVDKALGVGQRANGEKYCELPDGHRTTFVVGMCDMLEIALLYAAPEHKARLETMIRYEGKIESDALRQLFDRYMGADGNRLKYQAASCFFNALNEWSEFEERI